MALISGWDDWKKCTNHGLRALGVTTLVSSKENNLTNKAVLNHSRHANAKSQKPYLRETVTNKSTLPDALIGKLESEKDSDFRDLKRKFDELEKNMKRSVRTKRDGGCLYAVHYIAVFLRYCLFSFLNCLFFIIFRMADCFFCIYRN